MKLKLLWVFLAGAFSFFVSSSAILADEDSAASDVDYATGDSFDGNGSAGDASRYSVDDEPVSTATDTTTADTAWIYDSTPVGTSGSAAPASGSCYDEFGGTIPCTYDPTTGTPLSGSTGVCTVEGATCRLNNTTNGICASVAGDFGSSLSCVQGSATSVCSVEGATCRLNNTTNGVCASVTGDFESSLSCVQGNATGTNPVGNTGGTPSTGTNPTGNTANGGNGGTRPAGNTANGGSPIPTGTNTNPTAGNAGGGGATSNRPNPLATNTATGLHIPTSAETGLSSNTVTSLVQNFMKWLLYMVGFIAIIAFVISGIQYLLAAGDAKMAETAKANMQYAIIGVIVALSALIIIRAVQSVLAGAWVF